jgi:iron-sulfur cluster assembly protein
MLAVTEKAVSAIDGILASPELPDKAGMRITTETAPTEGGAPQTELRLAVVDQPETSDQVLEDAPVFLEPEAAAILDDKVLDAEVAGDQVRFNLKEEEG